MTGNEPLLGERCVDLAEAFLADELTRTGTASETSVLVLSLAAAIQDAIDAWYTTHEGPDEEIVPAPV